MWANNGDGSPETVSPGPGAPCRSPQQEPNGSEQRSQGRQRQPQLGVGPVPVGSGPSGRGAGTSFHPDAAWGPPLGDANASSPVLTPNLKIVQFIVHLLLMIFGGHFQLTRFS